MDPRQCYPLKWSTSHSVCSIFNAEQLDDFRVDDLTRLEQLREAVVIQSAKHHDAMRRYHARNICSCSFKVGDFVL
jgi:hypothetical protein